MALLGIVLLIVGLGPHLAPSDPRTMSAVSLAGPSSEHLLGTDSLGRDVLSRVLHGGTSVIALPLLATSLAFVLGGVVGASAVLRGGRIDAVVGRILEVALSLPPLVIVLVVATSLGRGSGVLCVALALVFSPRIATVVRGATRGIVAQPYVEVARARGESTMSLLVREVAPNALPIALAEFSVRLSQCVVAFATLNFLGLGLQPPSPNWGVMVAESRSVLQVAPLAALAPAAAIGMLALSVSLIADAVTQHHGLGTTAARR